MYARRDDAYQVEGFAGPLIHQRIRGLVDDFVDHDWRVALLEAGKIYVGRRPYRKIIDVVRADRVLPRFTIGLE